MRLAPPSQLRGAVLGCQAVVALCVAALALNGIDSLAVGCITAAGAAAPLLATLPGVARGRRGVEQWLALLFVAYAGATSVEVVASSGRAHVASVALLAALLGLGCLLALIRSFPSRPRAAHE